MDKRRMCPNCRAFITTDDKVCPYCEARVGPRAIDVRSPGNLLGGLIPHAQFTTMVILTANVGLYIVTMLYSMRGGNDSALMGLDGETLYLFGAKLRAAIFADGEYWRLITAGFLHGGLLHILMNSWVLFDLGAQTEQVYGTSRMVVIYIVGTITGFLGSSLWYAGLSVGASAGIFGLIGSMIALGVGKRRSRLGEALRGTYMRWVVYMLLFGLLPGLRIDNAAHIGGLIGGFAVGYLAGEPGLVAFSLKERVWNWVAVACLAATGASFALMFLTFRRYGGIF